MKKYHAEVTEAVVETTEPFTYSHGVTIGCEKWITVHRYKTFASCAERMRAFGEAGAQTMIVRFTSYDQKRQLARFLDEVVPLL